MNSPLNHLYNLRTFILEEWYLLLSSMVGRHLQAYKFPGIHFVTQQTHSINLS